MTLQQGEFILGGQFNEDGTTRLEVALLTAGDKTRLELRLLGWSEGIGWYVQKRMQLDPLQIRTLKAILGKGAGRVKSSAPQLATTHTIAQRERGYPQGLSLSLCP
jgi:hypothetical protein